MHFQKISVRRSSSVSCELSDSNSRRLLAGLSVGNVASQGIAGDIGESRLSVSCTELNPESESLESSSMQSFEDRKDEDEEGPVGGDNALAIVVKSWHEARWVASSSGAE